MEGHELRWTITKMRDLHDKIDAVKKRSKEEIQTFEEEIKKIQAQCPHPLKDYYPDASGNNDSSTYCQVCEKYLGH